MYFSGISHVVIYTFSKHLEDVKFDEFLVVVRELNIQVKN